MLTHQQILHFRTFGYVMLPGLLSTAEAATLRQEVTAALAGAFGKIATEPNDLGGISGDYLPLAVNHAPLSLALIADDPRTFQSSAELLGSPTVPSVGIATCFTGDSSWHTRQGPDVGGVTFWADLEPRTTSTGALRLIPGSHLPSFEQQLRQYRAVRSRVPVAGMTAIIVDDGLATGATMTAAVRAVASEDPRLLIAAVPVGSPQSVDAIQEMNDVDEVVCLSAPESFGGVGQFYRDFTQVSDEEVVEILKRFA